MSDPVQDSQSSQETIKRHPDRSSTCSSQKPTARKLRNSENVSGNIQQLQEPQICQSPPRESVTSKSKAKLGKVLQTSAEDGVSESSPSPQTVIKLRPTRSRLKASQDKTVSVEDTPSLNEKPSDDSTTKGNYFCHNLPVHCGDQLVLLL